jgi:hypothetical protein
VKARGVDERVVELSATSRRTRSGREYRGFTEGSPIKTDLRFAPALYKAVRTSCEIAEHHEGLAGPPRHARANKAGAFDTPTSMSPLTTPSTSRSASPTRSIAGSTQAVLDTTPTPPPSPLSPPPPSPTATGTPNTTARASTRGKRSRSQAQIDKGKARSKRRRLAKGTGAQRAGEGPGGGSEVRERRQRSVPRRSRSFATRHSNVRTMRSRPVQLALLVSRGGYTGRQEPGLQDEPWRLEGLLDEGFELFNWNGRWVEPATNPVHRSTGSSPPLYLRTPHVVLDECGNIVAALVGEPNEPDGRPKETTYRAACGRVAALLEGLRTGQDGRFSAEQRVHRRGAFPALSKGMSYGGGQEVRAWRFPRCRNQPPFLQYPQNLHLGSQAQERLMDALTSNADVQRIAGFQEGTSSATRIRTARSHV